MTPNPPKKLLYTHLSDSFIIYPFEVKALSNFSCHCLGACLSLHKNFINYTPYVLALPLHILFVVSCRFLLQISIKKCYFDIHLMYNQFMDCNNCKQYSFYYYSSNRDINFKVVDIFLLSTP